MGGAMVGVQGVRVGSSAFLTVVLDALAEGMLCAFLFVINESGSLAMDAVMEDCLCRLARVLSDS